MRVLVVVAHPDDEVLGCGGTISLMAGQGHDVFVAILGEGITSRFAAVDDQARALLKELHHRSREVSALLGVKELFLFSLPDNRFDTVPLLELVKQVEKVIQEVQPEVIFTHHGGDLNIDHALTFRAVLTSTRPTKRCPLKTLYTFEVPSSTEWAFGQFGGTFNPNFFVEVTSTLELKIKAMEHYESEAREFPHPRSAEALRALARYRGATAGLPAAEAFQLIRQIY